MDIDDILAGSDYSNPKRTEHGESSNAFFVTDVEDVEWVVKVLSAEKSARVTGQALLVNSLQSLGYPAPEHLAAISANNNVLQLSRKSPGVSSRLVTHRVVDEILTIVELQSGLGHLDTWSTTTWTEQILESLLVGFEGYCEHRPLREFDDQSRQLLDWCQSVAREHSAGVLQAHDVVHYDLHCLNILHENDRIAAVVDWEGARAGDRWFDVVTFAYNSAVMDRESGVVERMRGSLRESVDPALLRLYVAHIILRLTDWSIRHYSAERTRFWMTWAQDWRHWIQSPT